MSELRYAVVGDEALPGQAAATVALQLRAAIELRGRAFLALSGGTTPIPMFAALARWDLPWDAVQLLQVDERIGPAVGDGDRNLTAQLRELVEPAGIPAGNVHAWPTDADDVLASALAVYAAAVGEHRIDVVHLGVGTDGHTASLLPDDPAEEVTDTPVAVTGAYEGHRRVTLTHPVLAAARSRVWLVAGAAKHDALQALRRGDPDIPAGRVPHESSFVLVDAAADTGS